MIESTMLNQTAEYALRATLLLAESRSDEPADVGAIAEALDVPRNYLSKVLHVLAREGILISTRGRHGGFRLADGAERMTVADIIAPFDPFTDRCLLMNRRCSDTDPCIAHHEWKNVATGIRDFFRRTTLRELVESARAHGGRTRPRPAARRRAPAAHSGSPTRSGRGPRRRRD
jgi:Rrf2 family iron-sulfur cluster assembly transcriptional regulator